VTIDERRRKITKREAIVAQMVDKSASADLRATKMLIDMMKGVEHKAIGDAAPPPDPCRLAAADKEVGRCLSRGSAGRSCKRSRSKGGGAARVALSGAGPRSGRPTCLSKLPYGGDYSAQAVRCGPFRSFPPPPCGSGRRF
jgi:hypothetical protein